MGRAGVRISPTSSLLSSSVRAGVITNGYATVLLDTTVIRGEGSAQEIDVYEVGEINELENIYLVSYTSWFQQIAQHFTFGRSNVEHDNLFDTAHVYITAWTRGAHR